MKKGFYLLVLFIVLAGFLFSSCSSAASTTQTSAPAASTTSASAKPTSSVQASPSTPTPQTGGVFKILYNRDHTIIGYPAGMSGVGQFLVYPSMDALLNFDDNLNFLPTHLATGFVVAADGKSATLNLRKGVKFHDGTDFNAAAVKWNLEQFKAAKSAGTEQWTTIEAIDESTVRINLSAYNNTFPSNLNSLQGMSVSPTAFDKNGKEWANTHPVGTGAFKLKSFEQDVSLVYERFDGYWQKGFPYLDRIEIKFFTDAMTGAAGFQAGEAQMLFQSDVSQAKNLQNQGFTVLAKMSSQISLFPDSANPTSPLANLKVRQAIDYAINKEVISQLGNGYWRAMDQIGVPESPIGYNAGIGRKYDIAKAKQLLTEAGYASGFETRIIMDSTAPYSDALLAVQSDLKAVGITCKIENYPRAKYLEFRNGGWTNGLIYYTTGTVQNYLVTLQRALTPPTINFSTARPSGFVQTLADAAAVTDVAALGVKTKALVKTLQDEVTYIPLFMTGEPVPVSKTVQDLALYKKFTTYDWEPGKIWLSK